MSQDPYRVTMAQVEDALQILGIQGVNDIRRVEFEPGRITIERMRKDESGQAYVTLGYDVATVTVTVSVVG